METKICPIHTDLTLNLFEGSLTCFDNSLTIHLNDLRNKCVTKLQKSVVKN